MRKALIGGLVGCAVAVVLYPLMYFAAVRPLGGYSAIIYSVGSIAWPGSLLLMAVTEAGSALFAVTVFSLAILSNALIYALFFGVIGATYSRFLRRTAH